MSFKARMKFALTVIFVSISLTTNGEECSLYLGPTVIPGAGRGVIVGQSMVNLSLIEFDPSLTIPRTNEVKNWPLFNYVYGANEENESLVVFGVSMMFNHFHTPNIARWWATSPVTPSYVQKNEAHSTLTDVFHEAKRDIQVGEELVTDYGVDSWFEQRGIVLDPNLVEIAVRNISEVIADSFCLSDVYVNTSTIPLAGRGLFAGKNFSRGDIVTISPAVAQPKHEVIDISDRTILLNFCISTKNSDVSVLPIGLSTMINHGGILANVELIWYAWPTDDTTMFALRKSADNIVKTSSAELYLGYRATKDINQGDEIFLNYGIEWERKWLTHLHQLDDWLNESDRGESLKPIFRHTIEAPPHLFPKWWQGYCAGDSCEVLRQGEPLNYLEIQMKKANNLNEAIQVAKETFVTLSS